MSSKAKTGCGIKSLLRKSKRTLRNIPLMPRIWAKWTSDRRHLPLTPDHWELYDIIHRSCWRELHDFPNLVNCRDFNDRIQWLKLFDQDPQIIRCSDKIQVRDYIRERVGGRYLVDIYQVCDRFTHIDFDSLPDAFVIKVNHDSGSVMLVRDKAKFNRKAAEERVEFLLRRPYGWENGEWAYSYIQPKVFVEQFIEPGEASQPPDYKFYCIEGRVKFCHFIYNRGAEPTEQTIDRDGNDMKTELQAKFKLGAGFKIPHAWDKMVSLAESLGNGFKCVRVDLYCTKDHIFAGELTFHPGAGHYPGSGQRLIGDLLDFDRSTFKSCILPELEEKSSRFDFFPILRC